jgi:hypothetical protein
MEEKYRTQYSFKMKDGKKPWPADEKEFIRFYTERDMNQIKETLDERCESGAQTRVIRNILHLPVAFPPHPNNKSMHDGIAKRFYIVRYTLDASNQLVQQAQLASFQQAILGIYGMPAPALSPPRIKEIQAPEEDDVPEDIETEPTDPESTLIDFENASPEEQERTILDLIKRTGYKHHEADMKGNPPLHLWAQTNRTDYFKHLLSQKGAAA